MSRILLVDDDPLIRSTYSRVLTDAGYCITEAEDGQVAIEILSTSPFDLVIVDLVMPEADGVEVIEQVRTLCPEIKIVAMTGGGILSATDYLKMAKHLGASFTLTKPCSREELLVLTAEALRTSEKDNS